MFNLQVGIISETLYQQGRLQNIVEECGCRVGTAWLVDQVLKDIDLLSQIKSMDVWIADVDTAIFEHRQHAQAFEHWLFDLKQPLIFSESLTDNTPNANADGWARQLSAKLMSISGQLALTRKHQKPANYVWVLAASTGGPAAVKQFLDHLPTGLSIAFLYAQHIGPEQHNTLIQTVVRNSQYSCRMAQHGDIVTADVVTMVPSNQQLDLSEDGAIILHQQPWRGKYKPSIDQVVAAVGQCFDHRSGAIFFSGMGEDGIMGARLMARSKGSIWVQSSESCVSSSMPEAINKTGKVTASGTPLQLADYLERQFKSLYQFKATI